MNTTNKFLFLLVVVLIVALVGIVVWQTGMVKGSYYAVYLRTGDLYFGKLVRFPRFGLKNVYLFQVTQNEQSPVNIQRFRDVFWGPEDAISINRDQVMWMAKLRSDGQLSQLLKNNPSLAPQQGAGQGATGTQGVNERGAPPPSSVFSNETSTIIGE